MSYAILLWLQTLAGLGLLALIGGWALVPFRREDRPYLWLSAPVAGIAVLSLLMTLLCRLAGMAVVPALAVISVLCIPVTVVGAYRRWREGAGIRTGLVPLAAILAVSFWATYTCNQASLLHEQAALFARDGTDMVGYAQMADWFLSHPGERPDWSPNRPDQAFPRILYDRDPRWGTFLFLAAVSGVRRSTALMSYDFVSGLVLASAVLALAGGYSARRTGVVLLVIAGSLSMWLAMGRSGYLAKVVAYPASIWLGSLYLTSAASPSIRRGLALTLLSTGIGLAHSLPAMACVLGLIGAPATLFATAGAWRTAAAGAWKAALGCIARYGLLFGTPLLPLWAVYAGLRIGIAPGGHEKTWDWEHIVVMSLGLGGWSGATLSGDLLRLLLALNTVGLITLAWAAWRQRALESASLLLVVWAIPATYLLGKNWHLYQIQGVFFPLGAAAAVTLWESQRRPEGAPGVKWTCAAALLLMLVLRIPQAQESWSRYVTPAGDPEFCFTKTELANVRAATAGYTVRLVTSNIRPSLVLLADHAAHGRTLQFSAAAWKTLFGYTPWTVPEYADPPAMLIAPASSPAQPSAILVSSDQFRVIDCRSIITLQPLSVPNRLERSDQGEDIFWQGVEPSCWEALNLTDHVASLLITALLQRGPDHPEETELQVFVESQGIESVQTLSRARKWTLQVPVAIPPGRHTIRLWPETPQVMRTGGTDVRDRLFLVSKLTLEPLRETLPLTLTPLSVPHRLERDANGEAVFWQGAQPSCFELVNPLGRTALVQLNAITPCGPNLADPSQCTWQIRFRGGLSSHHVTASNGWTFHHHLEVPPGKHLLELWSQDPAKAIPGSPDPRDRLLLVRRLRVDETTPADEIQKVAFPTVPHGLERDAEQRPIFWQGAEPSVVQLTNPFERQFNALLSFEAPRGPNHPHASEGVLELEFGDRRWSQPVRAADRWQVSFPVTLGPGTHTLKVWTEEEAVQPPQVKDPRDRLYLVRNVTVRDVEEAPAVAAEAADESAAAR